MPPRTTSPSPGGHSALPSQGRSRRASRHPRLKTDLFRDSVGRGGRGAGSDLKRRRPPGVVRRARCNAVAMPGRFAVGGSGRSQTRKDHPARSRSQPPHCRTSGMLRQQRRQRPTRRLERHLCGANAARGHRFRDARRDARRWPDVVADDVCQPASPAVTTLRDRTVARARRGSVRTLRSQRRSSSSSPRPRNGVVILFGRDRRGRGRGCSVRSGSTSLGLLIASCPWDLVGHGSECTDHVREHSVTLGRAAFSWLQLLRSRLMK